MASEDCEDLDELRAAALASLMLANAQKMVPQTNSVAGRNDHTERSPRHDGFCPRVERSLFIDTTTDRSMGLTGLGFAPPVVQQRRPRDQHSHISNYGHHHSSAVVAASRRHDDQDRSWTTPFAAKRPYVWRKSPPPPHRSRGEIIFEKTNLIVLSQLPPQDDADIQETTRQATKDDPGTAAVEPAGRSPMATVCTDIASGAVTTGNPVRACRDGREARPPPCRYNSLSAHRWQRAAGSQAALDGRSSHRTSASVTAASTTSTKAKSSVPRRFRRLEEQSDSDDSDSDSSAESERSLSGARSSSPPSRCGSGNEAEAATSGTAESVCSTSRSAGDCSQPPTVSVEAAEQSQAFNHSSRVAASAGTATRPVAATASSAAPQLGGVASSQAVIPKPETAAVVLLAERRLESTVSDVSVRSSNSSSSHTLPSQRQSREVPPSKARSDVTRPGQQKQPSEVAVRRTLAAAVQCDSSKSRGAGPSGSNLASPGQQLESAPSTSVQLAVSVASAHVVPAAAVFLAASRTARELPRSGGVLPDSSAAGEAVDRHVLGRRKYSDTLEAPAAAAPAAVVSSVGQSAGPQPAEARATASRRSDDRRCQRAPSLSESNAEVRAGSGVARRAGSDTDRCDSASRRPGDTVKLSTESRSACADSSLSLAADSCEARRDGGACRVRDGLLRVGTSARQEQPENSNRIRTAAKRPLADRLGKRPDNLMLSGCSASAAATDIAPAASAAAPGAVSAPGATIGNRSNARMGTALPLGESAVKPDDAGNAGARLSHVPLHPSMGATLDVATGSSSSRTCPSASEQQRSAMSIGRSTDHLSTLAAAATVRPQTVGKSLAANDAGLLGIAAADLSIALAVELPKRDRVWTTARTTNAVAKAAASPGHVSQLPQADSDRDIATTDLTGTADSSASRVAEKSSQQILDQRRKLEARRLKFGLIPADQQPPSQPTSRRQRHLDRRILQAQSLPTAASADTSPKVSASFCTNDGSSDHALTSATATAVAKMPIAVSTAHPAVKRRSEGSERSDKLESEPPIKHLLLPIATSSTDTLYLQSPAFRAVTASSSDGEGSVPEPPRKSDLRAGDDRHVIVVDSSEQQAGDSRPNRMEHFSTAGRRPNSSSSALSLRGDLQATGSGSNSRSKASVLSRLGHVVVNVTRDEALPIETATSSVELPQATDLLEVNTVGIRWGHQKRPNTPPTAFSLEEVRMRVQQPPVAIISEDSGAKRSRQSTRGQPERARIVCTDESLLLPVEVKSPSSTVIGPKRLLQLEHRPLLPEQHRVLTDPLPKMAEQPQEQVPLLPRQLDDQEPHSNSNPPPPAVDRGQRQVGHQDVVAQQPRHIHADRRRRRGAGSDRPSRDASKGSSQSTKPASVLQRVLQPDRRPSDDSRQPLSRDIRHSRVAFEESDKSAAEAQLDERIRKIKEKNAVILQRHQMIEAEKQQQMGY